jgi:hypothetical protein
MKYDEQTPARLIDQLRAWFFPKDRSVWLADNTALILDKDGDTSISAPTDDQIDFETGGSDVAYFNDDGLALTSGNFIESPEITKPANPAANRRRIYPKTDGWYDLQDDGTETQISEDGGILVHTHNTTTQGGNEINPKVFFNEIVNGGHSDFATAQAAINYANTNGYFHVYFPAGTYDNITISTAGLTVEGASASQTEFEDTADHCIEINASQVTIKNLRVKGTAGGGNAYDAIHVNNGINFCNIRGVNFNSSDRYGLYSDALNIAMSNCNFGGGASFDAVKIFLDTNSVDNVVVANSNIDADTTDNGTTNVIASNS